MGLILDDLCVFIGVIVIWFAKGCKYSLWQELQQVKPLDFFHRIEGVVGLAAVPVIGLFVWAFLRLH